MATAGVETGMLTTVASDAKLEVVTGVVLPATTNTEYHSYTP